MCKSLRLQAATVLLNSLTVDTGYEFVVAPNSLTAMPRGGNDPGTGDSGPIRDYLLFLIRAFAEAARDDPRLKLLARLIRRSRKLTALDRQALFTELARVNPLYGFLDHRPVPAEVGLKAVKGNAGNDYYPLKKAWAALWHGEAVDWGDTRVGDKVLFLQMLREVVAKSALMRQLILAIGTPPFFPFTILLRNPREGVQFVDSFAHDTINLGDIAFFPETPQEQPFEITRGEHLIHILAERRFSMTDPTAFRFLQFRRAREAFQPSHRHARQAHNDYRAEQGQPREVAEETRQKVEEGDKVTFTYQGDLVEVLYVDKAGKPLRKEFP